MSTHHDTADHAAMRRNLVNQPFPRGALAAAIALVGFALVASAIGGLSGPTEIVVTEAPEAAGLDVRFADRADGAVVVSAAEDGRELAVMPGGTNGFLRGMLRGLARERRANGIGSEPPFRVVRWADGRHSLHDETTGRTIVLDAFGQTNAAVFAALIEEGTRR